MITCPVCGTQNPPERTYCQRCAAELRPPAPPLPPVPEPIPPPPPPNRTPWLVAGAVAAALLIALVLLAVVLGGGPASSPTPLPTPPPTPAPTVPVPTVAPTLAPPVTPGPTPTRNLQPTFTSVEAPEVARCSDPNFPGTIRLAWTIANATGVTLAIDGPGLYQSYPGQSGADDVPFACGEEQHVYTLTTTGGQGPAAARQIVVRRG